ncbi:alpha/beta hydrolase [Nitrosospira multiformis]|uniref:Phospholipase/Carboxylesterase n=1 Tax=Nitrosospira multiformis (strain ATCC 25196 / NCIMB 11849 / C 71) TaxID=323848 RepID=Q2Y6C0_NITMU|nr:alpha/beta hydrolase-fold protein [Nitrosospira multiformis]ABB75701.1 Phospholipase/Carboxylesterase [Nitrosospira multiformis ATCC 25196]SEA42994.1 phospholipase/carboxylesterase [Nitrosospira multiformis]SEF90099.1 phospholipase/carboxylesterase [Nitrosospira multiformis ATCC 25196]
MISGSPDLLPSIELETAAHPTRTIIWMHGLGADGSDFVPVVDELALPSIPAVRFVFPHAPTRPVSINRGMVMRAWYDYDIVDGAKLQENMATLRESERAVEALVNHETQRGVKPENIVLAGFSQGGALALFAGLRYPEKLAGIMALSCYLPAPQTLAEEAHSANFGIPIFMAHGVGDNVIPITLAAASRQQLLGTGYPVEWREYGMAHTVCREEIHDIRNWLQRVLA